MKRYLTFTLATITATSLLASCNAATLEETTEEVIKIGYLPITHAAPLYYTHAHQEELLEDGQKVELVRFGTWIDLMDALNTGRIDGASVLFELAMKAHEKEIDLKSVALGHRDGNAIIAGHHIESAKDLRGETIAIPHTLSSHNILLDDMLEKSGISYEDVNVVELPPAEMPAALGENRISSYIVAEPFGALGVSLDTGHVLYQSEELWPNSLCCALVLRQDFMDKHPELARTFVNGYADAGAALESHDHESQETHLHYLNVNEDVLELSLNWISYDDLAIKEDDYELLRQRVQEMGLSDNPPTYAEFVDRSYLEEAE